MVLAWIVLSPGASFIARYCRSRDRWFIAHRNTQAAALVISVLSAYLIIDARGWETEWGPHGQYGAIVIVLGLLQAYGGFQRKSIHRPVFNKFHRAIGIATSVLAAYNCAGGAGMLARFESQSALAGRTPSAVRALTYSMIAAFVLAEYRWRRLLSKSAKSMV
jgi:hypothetical protein